MHLLFTFSHHQSTVVCLLGCILIKYLKLLLQFVMFLFLLLNDVTELSIVSGPPRFQFLLMLSCWPVCIATLCFTARRPRISTSCSEFRTLLLASSPDLDALNMRCLYSPNYTGCRSNNEYNTRLPLQCSRSWQHNSRATLPTSSSFVLLHANFGPAEGICYTTIALIDKHGKKVAR